MEKFAVDLDAVLDEFEYHEGQVEKATKQYHCHQCHAHRKITDNFSNIFSFFRRPYRGPLHPPLSPVSSPPPVRRQHLLLPP